MTWLHANVLLRRRDVAELALSALVVSQLGEGEEGSVTQSLWRWCFSTGSEGKSVSSPIHPRLFRNIKKMTQMPMQWTLESVNCPPGDSLVN